MNARERVLKAVHREQPDRVPIYLWLTPALEERLGCERGVDDPESYYGMDIRFTEYCAAEETHDFTPYVGHFHPDTVVDSWGCGTYPVGYYHFTKAQCPLESATTVHEIEYYPFPQQIADLDAMSKQVKAIQAQGLLACSQYECGTFEQAHALMGMEPLLAHMVTSPVMVSVLFERISDIKARMAAAFVEAGVDMLWIGDDIGMQSGPMMSPQMWRGMVLPHLRKIINAAQSMRPDIPIAYHSCGFIEFAVKDLIDAGITVLQSLQPEANDLAALKQAFGTKLAFWGGAGSQSTLSHGTPEEVRKEVKRLIETVGNGGGYICSPAHFVEPECPLENIDAFVEAAYSYGRYHA